MEENINATNNVIEQNAQLNMLNQEVQQSSEIIDGLIAKTNGLQVDPNAYKISASNLKTKNQIDIFHILHRLNVFTDIYASYNPNDCAKTIIKESYEPKEIRELIEKTDSLNLDDFVQKVIHSNKDEKNKDIKSVAKNVRKILENLRSEEQTNLKPSRSSRSGELTADINNKFIASPEFFVKNVTRSYGDNAYYEKGESRGFAPLEITEKIDCSNAIKRCGEVYNFKEELTDEEKTTYGQNSIDETLLRYFKIARNMDNTRNISATQGKCLVGQDADDSLREKFNNHKEEIKDVIALLTTIYMSRFDFDYQVFPQIEKELSLQVANKMKFLKFSEDLEEDYSLIKLIENQTLKNVRAVSKANGIVSEEGSVNLKKLAEIYSNNGTVIKKPEYCFTLNDLVTEQNISKNEKAENKVNLINNYEEKNKKQVEAIKKQEKDAKRPQKLNYDNAYLQKLRESPEYKKIYKEYEERLKNLYMPNSYVVRKSLEEIKENTENNLNKLAELASKKLSSEDQKSVANELAINEAILDKSNEELEKIPTESKDSIQSKQPTVEVQTKDEDLTPKEQPIDEEQTEDKDTASIEDHAEMKKAIPLHTQKSINKMTLDEIEDKIAKHLAKLIYGKNKEPGLLNEYVLNARVKNPQLEKLSKRKSYESDNVRLNKEVSQKVNEIRDEKIEDLIEKLTKEITKFAVTEKEKTQNITRIPTLCNTYMKNELNKPETSEYTKKNLKQDLAVAISSMTNIELEKEGLNAELYVVKDIYKKHEETGQIIANIASEKTMIPQD